MHERVIIQRVVTQNFKKYHENNKERKVSRIGAKLLH